MGDAKNVIETRQAAERLPFDFGSDDSLAAAAEIETAVRRGNGYDAVVGLLTAGGGEFTVLILGAPAVPETDPKENQQDAPGTFVVLATLVSAVDAVTGRNVVTVGTQVRAPFVKARLVAGASDLSLIEATLDLLPISAAGGGSGGGGEGGAVPNRESFATGQVTVPIPGTAVQMPAQAIPDGFAVVIRAKGSNTMDVFVGNSAANAQNPAVRYILEAGEFVTLYITDLSLAFIDAAIADEGVDWIVET
jgi:hypothetical protein